MKSSLVSLLASLLVTAVMVSALRWLHPAVLVDWMFPLVWLIASSAAVTLLLSHHD